jgi:hypothetical protein
LWAYPGRRWKRGLRKAVILAGKPGYWAFLKKKSADCIRTNFTARHPYPSDDALYGEIAGRFPKTPRAFRNRRYGRKMSSSFIPSPDGKDALGVYEMV